MTRAATVASHAEAPERADCCRHGWWFLASGSSSRGCPASSRFDSGPLPTSRRRRGLSLVELLTLVAVLGILLGLMVSLSRRVRAEASTQLLRQVLVELEDALDDYAAATGRLPDVPPLHPPGQPMPADEATLRERAAANNRRFVQLLGIGIRPHGGAAADSPTLGGLSAELFDGSILRDPWGTPIVYVAAGDPYLGFAQADRPFFLSAGPDGRFLTREDNFYSYEVLGHLEPQDPLEEQPGHAGG